MTGFRRDLPVRAYSGGTVRDLHTIPYSSGAVFRRAGHCELSCLYLADNRKYTISHGS
jgi:hypothetical protein